MDDRLQARLHSCMYGICANPNPNPDPNPNPNPTPKAEEWEDPWLGTVAPPGLEHAVARPYDRGAFPVRCAYARVGVGGGSAGHGGRAASEAKVAEGGI